MNASIAVYVLIYATILKLHLVSLTLLGLTVAKFKPLHVNYVYRFSSYLAGNTLHVCYKVQPVNVV
jgi:hypothetical protein